MTATTRRPDSTWGIAGGRSSSSREGAAGPGSADPVPLGLSSLSRAAPVSIGVRSRACEASPVADAVSASAVPSVCDAISRSSVTCSAGPGSPSATTSGWSGRLNPCAEHYNRGRPHRGLALATPLAEPQGPMPVSPRDVRRRDLLGGLIHEYHGLAA